METKDIILRTGKVLAIVTVLLISTDLFPQESELFTKVRENDANAVRALIAAGEDVNYQQDDMMGYTALELTRDSVMMKVLISAGADINHKSKMTGYTPLMNALNSCNNEIAGFLIRQGADINIRADDGTTALILACGCSEDIARQLLAKGADVHALTDRGMGAFSQCANIGLRRETVTYEFAEFLLSEGADIDETNTTDYYGGYTPLLWAVESGNEKLVSFLVKHGANVNAKSNMGKTPLSIAAEGGFTAIIDILKAADAK